MQEEIMTIRIADWVDSQPRWRVVVVGYIIFASLYGVSNNISFVEAREIPFLLGEERIPFVLWTMLVYLSVIGQIMWGFLSLRNGRFGRAVAVAFFLVLAHVAVFLVYPTVLHRTHEVVGHDWLVWGYGVMCAVDKPANCFPSLHVSMAIFTAFVLQRESRVRGLLFFLWALIIAVTTLTTKQHYLLDVLGGGVTATIAYLVYRRGL